MQVFMQILARTYLGPTFEKLELYLHRKIVLHAQKNNKIAKFFQSFLVKELSSQIQKLNVRDYQRCQELEDQLFITAQKEAKKK